MVGTGRKKSIAFFIALGVGMISIAILLYVGWVLLNWRTGILLFLGVILLAVIIAGVVLNTTFLVREIRRNEQHDAFINAMTHELKTPVASIRLYAETLRTRPVTEEQRRQFSEIILADCDRLLGSVEQILRTGRLGASSRKPQVVQLDLREVVNECVARARFLHHLTAEQLEFAPGPPLEIPADAEEVRAAVANLIDNAVKYSGDHVHVTVAAGKEQERYAVLRVRDNGPGIPKTELKRIFRRFYRVDGALSRRVKGTGLGLYIVRSVARRHSGRAWAESDGPGSGSTFVLQFPLVR